MKRFAEAILAWQRDHGRRELPWQQPATPYRVWISEIMLQQTQVATVIPYFQRFIAAFPDAPSLAAADQDEVLAHWSGLGYYARARNLHQAARIVTDAYGGELPPDPEALQRLPGIGRSTAGAILALAYQQPAPILDGNVKRVLARFHGIAGWPGRAAVSRKLWEQAEQHVPAHAPAAYTQGLMDLGALVCTPRQPRCTTCPLTADCVARQAGQPEALPGRRPPKQQPVRYARMLVIEHPERGILLERQPPTGLWGGLWSLPRCDEAEPAAWVKETLGLTVTASQHLAPFNHDFTHFRLAIEPWRIVVRGHGRRVMDDARHIWYKSTDMDGLGLPAPVRRLLAGAV